MTLYRQLALTIIVVFIAGFLGTAIISVGNLRLFLDKQLQTHAQDTATSLGLSLSSPMQDEDLPVMRSMVDAIFDRGYYQSIRVVGSDGTPLIERTGTIDIEGIPAWFRRHITLETPVAEAQVLAGWKTAATVRVTSHPGHAYHELWNNTVETFWMYLLAMLAVLGLGLMAVHHLLKPLRGIAVQARDICNGNYPVQENLPQIRELRSVVKAMNRLALRVRETFAEQSARTEKLRQQAFMDDLTEIGNRRYFEQQLLNLLHAHEESSPGELIVLELKHLEQINTGYGYQAGDRLLRRTAELIRQRAHEYTSSDVARLSGTRFGIIATGLSRAEVDTLAEDLRRGLIQLYEGYQAGYGDVAVIGISGWQTGDELSDILANADMALRRARLLGNNAWYRHETTVVPEQLRDARQWRTFLDEAIRAKRAVLFAQPVFATAVDSHRLPGKEIFLRIRDRDDDDMTAGMFMPMAEYTGLASDLDKLAINMLIEYLKAGSARGSSYAVNLASGSLQHPDFLQWLYDKLAANGHCRSQLAFEIPEAAILRDLDTAHDFIGRLKHLQYSCGIDHFGHGFHSFGYLSGIGASYLKIDRGYVNRIDKDSDNRFLVKTVVDAAHSLDIKVIAGGVETGAEKKTLETLNVDGMQGYFFAKPESLRNEEPDSSHDVCTAEQSDNSVSR